MRSLPDDLAMLYRQKIRESENQTAGTVPNQAPSTEERAESVNALLHFLRIRVETKEERLGAVYFQPRGHPSLDSGAQCLYQEPADH